MEVNVIIFRELFLLLFNVPVVYVVTQEDNKDFIVKWKAYRGITYADTEHILILSRK